MRGVLVMTAVALSLVGCGQTRQEAAASAAKADAAARVPAASANAMGGGNMAAGGMAAGDMTAGDMRRGNVAGGNAAAPVGPGNPQMSQFVTGRWSATNDCSQAMEFRASGEALRGPGAAPDRWSMVTQGDADVLRIVVAGGGPPQDARVARAGDRLTVMPTDGPEQIQLQRCPAG